MTRLKTKKRREMKIRSSLGWRERRTLEASGNCTSELITYKVNECLKLESNDKLRVAAQCHLWRAARDIVGPARSVIQTYCYMPRFIFKVVLARSLASSLATPKYTAPSPFAQSISYSLIYLTLYFRPLYTYRTLRTAISSYENHTSMIVYIQTMVYIGKRGVWIKQSGR